MSNVRRCSQMPGSQERRSTVGRSCDARSRCSANVLALRLCSRSARAVRPQAASARLSHSHRGMGAVVHALHASRHPVGRRGESSFEGSEKMAAPSKGLHRQVSSRSLASHVNSIHSISGLLMASKVACRFTFKAAPNPSVKRTPSSRLRQLPVAAYLER
jgi:hypothetical protein